MTRNSNMISAVDPASKKPMKRHITCPKVRFGGKVMFSGHYGSLEVIQRSFGGHLVTRNSNLMCAIGSASKKPMIRHVTCPKVRFGKKVMFSGPYGSHEVIQSSFGGQLVTRISNLMCAIDSASQKTYGKTYYMPQSESFHVAIGHLRLNRVHLKYKYLSMAI